MLVIFNDPASFISFFGAGYFLEHPTSSCRLVIASFPALNWGQMKNEYKHNMQSNSEKSFKIFTLDYLRIYQKKNGKYFTNVH